MAEKLSVRRAPHPIAAVLCLVGILVILAIVLGTTGLGPIDDHRFVTTLFQGKSFGAYVMPDLGRFIPLTAQEYALAAWLVEPSAFLFHALGGVKVFLAGALLLYCLTRTRANAIAVIAFWFVVIFSIGFANAAVRLQIGELNALVLTLVFIYSVLALEDHVTPRIIKRREVIAGLGVLALLVAFFYKELIFVFALVFAAAEIHRKHRQRQGIPRYLLALGFSGTVYIAAYALWRVSRVTGSYANLHAESIWTIILLYAENDPFIVFVVLPFAAFRFLRCVQTPRAQTIFDSLLFASTAYFAAYVALGMYNTYYLLPAYGFAACGLAGLLRFKSTPTAAAIVSLVSLIAVNNATVAVSDMRTLQLIANNHYGFVKAITFWVESHPRADSKSRNLVLAGVSPGTNVEILVSLEGFLTSLGAPKSAFDVQGTEPSDNLRISQFHGFGSSNGYQPRVGDLLIFNPYQLVPVRPPLQAPSFENIYRSKVESTSPRWTAWNWLDFCVLDRMGCKARQAGHSRYVGYTAMLVKRRPAELHMDALKAPKFELVDYSPPARLKTLTATRVDVAIRNIGMETWPANGTLAPGQFVHLAYRWKDMNGQIIMEGDRVAFPEPVQPNDLVKVPLIIATPTKPGKYILAVGPVQEAVRWFDGGDERTIDVY